MCPIRPFRWDSHGNMQDHRPKARRVDQPLAALLTDLKQRGLLDPTRVAIATEFGRTPRTDNPQSKDDLERLKLGRSPRFQDLLHRSRKSIKEGKSLSEKTFWEAVRKRAQDRKAAAPKERRTNLCWVGTLRLARAEKTGRISATVVSTRR